MILFRTFNKIYEIQLATVSIHKSQVLSFTPYTKIFYSYIPV
jgi:hypothetical protein